MEVKIYAIKLTPPRWLRHAIVYVVLPLGALMGGALAVRAGVALATFSPNTPLKSAEVNANFASLNSAIGQLQASVVTPGTVAAFAGPIDGNPGELVANKPPAHLPPSGWVYCNGAAFSRADPAYAPLFGAINIAWGVGDGVLTFNVPDLRGLFLRGLDVAAKNDKDGASRGIGSIELGALALHQHPVADVYHSHSVSFPAYQNVSGANWGFNQLYNNVSGYLGPVGATVSQEKSGITHTENFGGSETRPVNAAINYIIKL